MARTSMILTIPLSKSRAVSMRGLEMIKHKVKEFMTVWLFITMMGVGLVTVAVLMPLLALYRMIVALQDWWLLRDERR